MARNRVIYQSEALFVSEDVNSTSATDHNELIRVQGANYGFTINRTDVNQFGNLARIDSLVLEPPTVNFDFSYYVTNGYNESSLGFSIEPNAQFVSGFLESSSGRNFYVVTSEEGQDATTFDNGDFYNLIGIGNAFLTDYTIDMSVGSLPTASVTFEASNINSQNGTISSQSITGKLPSVQPEDGTIIQGTCYLNKPENTGQNGPTALRPGDIVLDFPGFDGGQDESGTMSTISGAGGFHIQSASLSIPLSRSPISRVGSKFPYARVVDFPVNASLNVNAVLNTVEAGNLASIIAGCGGNSSSKEVSVTLKSCEGVDSMKWTLKGATLDSESFSSAIGSNKSVDLTFGVQIGGIDDIDQGIIFSGSHGFGNKAPVIEFIGLQQNNDNDPINLQVNATDPEGNNITYNAINLPAGLSIDQNGLINGTINTNAYQSSPYSVTIQAIDDGEPQKTGTANFTWEVYQVNTAPTITPISNQTNDDEDPVSLQVNVTDAENDTLTYSAQGLPAGLSIDQNGLINGTIAAGANTSSPYNVTVQVDDDGFPPLSDTEQFTWTVNEAAILTTVYDSNDQLLSGIQGDIPDYWHNEFSNPTTDIHRLEIGSAVENIGFEAFDGNTNLSGALTIPSNVRYISGKAFNATKLNDLIFEEGITGIGWGGQDNNGAFSNITTLENINLPNTLKEIPDYCFYRSYGIKNITISDSVKNIGRWAFTSNRFDSNGPVQFSIESIDFGTGITGIGDWAFSRNIFDGGAYTGDFNLPSSLKRINEYAFGYMSSITGLILPDGLEHIGSYAFRGVTGALKLKIPSSVTYIGFQVFEQGLTNGVPEIEINCPTGSWQGTASFNNTASGIYRITGAYFADYTGGSWSGDQSVPGGSVFECFGDGCPGPLSWNQLGATITGDSDGSNFGKTLSMTKDASFVLVGDQDYDKPGSAGPDGYARLYENVGGTWTIRGNRLVGDLNNDELGSAVAIANSGLANPVLAIGARDDDGGGVDAGEVKIKEWNGSSIVDKGTNTPIFGDAGYDYLGSSASFSADGSILALGAAGRKDVIPQSITAGYVGVYQWNTPTANEWNQMGANITGGPNSIEDDEFGYSVALSSDGTHLIVGARYNDAGGGAGAEIGAAYVYESGSPNWTIKGNILTGQANNDNFGTSVSISADGTYIAVGGPYNDSGGTDAGHVRLYNWNVSDYVLRGTTITGAAGDLFGNSVSLSDDGNTVAIGAPSGDYVGVYSWGGSDWEQVGENITGAAGERFGETVSLSADGLTVAVGAPDADVDLGGGEGNVRIFTYS